MLRIWLNFTLFHRLFKLSILVHFLTEVSESLSLGVKEEIFELGEVELDCNALLLFLGLLLLGYRLCTHFVGIKVTSQIID